MAAFDDIRKAGDAIPDSPAPTINTSKASKLHSGRAELTCRMVSRAFTAAT